MSDQDRNNLKMRLRKAIEDSPYKSSIKKASLFGSYAYGTPGPDSDVDLLVELDHSSPIGLIRFLKIRSSLSEAIGKQIDLLTPSALSHFFRDEVLAKAQPIYG